MNFPSRCSCVLLLALVGCNGGGSSGPASQPGAGNPGTVANPNPSEVVTPVTPPSVQIVSACVAGSGKDYQVGPAAGQLAELDQVPWEALQAGDTVRIFYRAQPYRGKFMLAAQGSASAPVRVCGLRSADGKRPIIDGNNAVTRANQAYGHPLHESRSVIVIKPLATQDWTSFPRYIQIDGLEIRGAHPAYSFSDSAGVRHNYEVFGACIWIERGQHITLADNEIHDCSQGIFSKSTDDGDFAVTRDLRIAGNYLWGNGIVGEDHEHNSYVQSIGVVYEFNRYGPLRAGALGNLIKDRSAGTVVRYNSLTGGAHALDLVEAEDFPHAALADPSYRSTYVYGNLISKDGATGSVVHYGGDHYGASPGDWWGEPIYRKGTLYFFHNTLSIGASSGDTARLFQLSTTEESAEVWNNVFLFDAKLLYPALRQSSEVGTGWTSGGILRLGVNWASAGLADSDPWHPVAGSLTGWANLLTGTTTPFVGDSFVPLAGSQLIDRAQMNPAAVANYPLIWQLNGVSLVPELRAMNGAAADLGAVEAPPAR